jgi:hypothetical protein
VLLGHLVEFLLGTLEFVLGDVSVLFGGLERAEKELDKMTQEHVEQVDKAFTRKEQELLEV